MNEKNNFIGNNIKKYRKDRMTQKQLASLIGRSIDTIKKYEGGKATPPIEILTRIADALVISLDELLSNEVTSFSSKLITSILLIDYINIAGESDEYGFKTISHHTGIDINTLKNCIEKNIDLPIDDQLKLIDFWGEWGCDEDGIELEDFFHENAAKIKANPIISNRIKGILNIGTTKNDIEKLLDLLDKYDFKVNISKENDQNIISICNNDTNLVTEFESNLVPVYDEIVNKINSYSKFIIEEELKKLKKSNY